MSSNVTTYDGIEGTTWVSGGFAYQVLNTNKL